MKNSLTKTLFDFVWTPQDDLMALKPPLRYGRVEIALGDRIVEGVIERVLASGRGIVPGSPFDSYRLRISTDASADELTRADISVRVCG